MDPVSAIGLASAILTFVEFTSTLVSGAHEIYSSASGASAESDTADQAIDRLRDLTRRLPNVLPTQPLTADDRRLIALKTECVDVSDELGKILEAGRAKTPDSILYSLRASWKNIRNKPKIAALQSRLDRYRQELLGVLQAMMSDDVSETKEYLESLIKAQPKYAESLREDLGRTRVSIIKAIQAESQAGQNEQHSRAHEQQTSLERIQKDLTHLLETTKAIPAQDIVLDMLWFESITSRQRSVDPAHEATFRWLLYENGYNQSNSGGETERGDSDSGEEMESSESEPDKRWRKQYALEQREQEPVKRFENREAFLSWLRVGSGVFYISGKAGAGKSTLMKYLYQEGRTRQELKAWAESDGKRLILASFFFWNSGEKLQKSLEGLYRAILWDILRQSPDLIPHAFPDAWSAAIGETNHNARHHPSFHVELKDLHAALDRIITSSIIMKNYKLCLFIDGLDEFDGDYWKLSNAISGWATKDNVKFCVSSRPHNEFLAIFASDPLRHLRLHDLTRQDMIKFVWSELQGDKRSMTIRAKRRFYSWLIEDIVERADGIFLWVGLVTYEMLKAMGNHASPTQLRQRLNDTPQGLDGIFRRMFDDIDKKDRKRAAQTLLMMKLHFLLVSVSTIKYTSPFRWICTHSMMDEITDNPSILSRIYSGETRPPQTAMDWESSYQNTTARLMARCNGLVESEPVDYEDNPTITNIKLQFVHRSVSDFLDDEEIHDKLHKLAGEFCPWTVLIHSMLAMLQCFHLEFRDRSRVIKVILHAYAEAESLRLPPFNREIASLIHICRQLARTSESGYLGLDGVHVATGETHSNEINVSSDNIESVIISLGIWHGCKNYILERLTQDTALLTPRPHGGNILLAAFSPAIHGVGLTWRPVPGGPTNLLLQLLRIERSSFNAPSYSCWNHSDRKDPYFPIPSWTTWTTSLFLLLQEEIASGRRALEARRTLPEYAWYHELIEIRKQEVSTTIGICLEYGADASVCFILCDWKRYIQIHDDTQPRVGLDIDSLISYATLPAVIESVGLSLGQKARQALQSPYIKSTWNASRFFGFLRATEMPKVAIRELNALDLGSRAGDLVLVKVVAYTQLQDIKHEHIEQVLNTQTWWKEPRPTWHKPSISI